jgi:uncharacterized alkaline shock family protein YloU
VEVYALVGPAGTGKSHRASLVAQTYRAGLLIDDGLLIRDDRILSGISAKKEETAMAAVRRAIFADADQAREARAVIRRLRPDRILILGTSAEMVSRITDALDLPRPDKLIDISEVASPEEIRRARRTRRVEGKHVIPAPTFEVRKSFAGYLVDPLRVFHRPAGSRSRDLVVEKSVVRPTFSSLGRFFIADTVVEQIAGRAGAEVAGVVAARHASVEVRPEGVMVTLEITLQYGVHLPSVLRAVQLRVRTAVENMTALSVLAVDVIAQRVVSSSSPGAGTGGEPAPAAAAAEPAAAHPGASLGTVPAADPLDGGGAAG